MTIDLCFRIAHVVKTHGLKGEITFSLTTECPDLQTVKSVFLQVKGQLVPYFISAASVKGSKAYIKLDDVSTADDAERLVGCGVYIPKSQRPTLPKGEFYSDEVPGFEVIDSNSGSLGIVQEVLEMGSNRQLVVRGNGKEHWIPLNGPFITGVNKTRKQVLVTLPDGFLEL